ncbi:MAG TPA: hypothetical protein VNS61_18345 [Caldimonas sp.]|nr:hypothetical protein [Caldimonas sp.]
MSDLTTDPAAPVWIDVVANSPGRLDAARGGAILSSGSYMATGVTGFLNARIALQVEADRGWTIASWFVRRRTKRGLWLAEAPSWKPRIGARAGRLHCRSTEGEPTSAQLHSPPPGIPTREIHPWPSNFDETAHASRSGAPAWLLQRWPPSL